MKAARIGGGVVLLLVGAALLLMAASVRDAGRALEQADLATASAPQAIHPIHLGGPLPAPIPRRLLAIGDDLAFRRTLADWLYARGVATAPSITSEQASGEAQAALVPFTRDDTDPARVAFASTRLGVLAFDARPAGGGGGPSNEESAETAFRRAVEIDPFSDPAAFDLELILHQTHAESQRSSPGRQANGNGKGRRGAGSSAPGHGY
jgi:hypothetical protein